MTPAPVALVILDGFGLAPPGPGNAVVPGATRPSSTRSGSAMPHTTLVGSGRAVGLPEGQMGNSEVGHLNLGAGRVVPQDARADRRRGRRRLARREPGASRRPAPRRAPGAACSTWRASSPTAACTRTSTTCARSSCRARCAGVPQVAVHAFTDGRDVSPHQAAGLLEQLERGVGAAAGAHRHRASGRFYAMDRDRRGERTERARAALVDGVGERADGRGAAVARELRRRADRRVRRADRARRRPSCASQPGDPLFFVQLPPDRMRQICHALLADRSGCSRR